MVAGSADRAVVCARVSSPPSREWPVRYLTDVATPRWVRGIPSSEQMPEAAVIPGMQYVGIPGGLGYNIYNKNYKEILNK